PFYFSSFAILLPMVFTVGAWLLTGLPGFVAFRRSGIRAVWAIVLLAIPIWMYASSSWAFMAGSEHRMMITATAAATQFGIVVLFVLAAASAGPPPKSVITVLVIGLFWNSVLGGTQVALQHSTGLGRLGEFKLSITQPGISIIETNGIRWLRPYALMQHPNSLAPVFIVGLLTLVYGLTSRWWLTQFISFIVMVGGVWVFLLTFSRGGYLGFAAGSFALFPLLWRIKRAEQGLGIAVIVAAMIGLTFVLIYSPFLMARSGVGTTEPEPTEVYSVTERDLLTQLAYRAIDQNILVGVGAANFDWRASYYLFYDHSPVRGRYVHSTLLSIWAELGVVGLILFVLAMLLGIETVLQLIRAKNGDIAGRAVLLAGFLALIIAGMFEYYPYTMLQMQTLWWGILAIAIQPAPVQQGQISSGVPEQ
ncbi:MAG TPA: O-antigen ligase family protein, partial [Phototrophicaceae bacterium]|nr:O-antigen ligase family protein [Phototrophicaceae bacterium]